MYAEWVSLQAQINANSSGAQSLSVLNKFPASAGKEVVVAVVKQLANNLGITQNAEPSHLVTDLEVTWCMDVICYGLSLPLSEHETIKDCVNIYCEWLTALLPQPRISVPKPICEDPNIYCRRIIHHLHNLFVPRNGEAPETISRQAVICHRVLRTIQLTAQASKNMEQQTWENLLIFLLAINEILLAPPIVIDDVGDQLCERLLSVLFEVWLVACVRSFPSPPLWKTLQECCANWRHRSGLVDQWNRVSLALTSRLLDFTYGPGFPELKLSEEESHLIPVDMSNDCIAQSWYRFLHTIGNPSALCSPHLISKAPQFVQWAMLQNKGSDTNHHPCLQALPSIFLKAIKSISNQVDAFLGTYRSETQPNEENVTNLLDIRIALDEATTTSSSYYPYYTTNPTAHMVSPYIVTQNNVPNIYNYQSYYQHYANLQIHSATAVYHDQFSYGSTMFGYYRGYYSGYAPPPANPHCITALAENTTIVTGNTSNNGSQSAGVIGSMPNTSGYGATAAHSSNGQQQPHSPTPPLQRRLAKSFSVAPSVTQQKGLSKAALVGLSASRSSITQAPVTPTSGPPSASSITSIPSLIVEPRPQLSLLRPKCNSILNLFGEWLYEAALIGGDAWLMNTKRQATEASKRPSSMIMEHRKGSISLSQPSSLNDPTSLPPALTIDKFESGRAEAIGTLCKIYCAKKTGEEILPVYMVRFFMSLQQCMLATDSKECDETLASILLNSAEMFSLDLVGMQVLLPAYLVALEIVLPEKELKIKSQSNIINRTELRRAAIHILNSVLALPLHFQHLTIQELPNQNTTASLTTFMELKTRLINVLMNALQVETDAQNTQLLLGGLLFVVQDAVTYEELQFLAAEKAAAKDNANVNSNRNSASPAPTDANLQSSAGSERSASITSGGNSSLGGHSSATVGAFGAPPVSSYFSATAAAGAGAAGATGRDSASQHEFSSLSFSEDFAMEFILEFETASLYDNAHALFVRATYLVCHRLISTWKLDLNVSLAALELLTGLACLEIRDSESLVKIEEPSQNLTIISTDDLECKRAVKWICDYICYLCSRPPPCHSKDLHSTIVAAFQCLSTWLIRHPYLLEIPDCMQIVLEVVELGISGTKSVGRPGDIPKYKDEKELKPASMRVREAAENLLITMLEQVRSSPSSCCPETISSLLDEVALIKHCNSMPITYDASGGSITSEDAIAKFKYFVTDNSTILALLEEPLGNDQDPQPTVTMIIRGPFGRHSWTMQLRYLPRSKSGAKNHAINPGRPIPMNDAPQRVEFDQKYFPEGVDKLIPCVADYSIPTLEQIRELYGADVIRQLEGMVENQTIFEKLAWAETDNSSDSLTHAQECVPDPVCQEFQAARLFLSHFGFLSFEERDPNNPVEALCTTAPRSVIALDTKRGNFAAELNMLDKLSPRTHDTVHVFYVKAGQTLAQGIIANANDYNRHTLGVPFYQMLFGLGQPLDIEVHSGWTGFAHNSWILKDCDETPLQKYRRALAAVNELKFNGETRIMYWADVSSEIAFLMPTDWNARAEADGSGISLCSSNSSADSFQSVNANVPVTNIWSRGPDAYGTGSTKKGYLRSRNFSLELDIKSKDPIPPSRRKTNGMKSVLLTQPPAKILLVWLESFEDHLNFPIEDLLAYTRTGEEPQLLQALRAGDCHIIFLHALSSGLLRVKLQGPPGRMNFAIPLVDGMVISHRAVPDLVRQTAFNISRRRRLDNENYQPPHVRRRLKVQDIVEKYKMDLSEPELLAHLFKSSNN